MTLSSTLRPGNELRFWKIHPIFPFCGRGLVAQAFSPPNRTSPSLGLSNRPEIPKTVDFPEPDGPMSAAVSVAASDKENPLTTSFPFLYEYDTFLRSRDKANRPGSESG